MILRQARRWSGNNRRFQHQRQFIFIVLPIYQTRMLYFRQHDIDQLHYTDTGASVSPYIINTSMFDQIAEYSYPTCIHSNLNGEYKTCTLAHIQVKLGFRAEVPILFFSPKYTQKQVYINESMLFTCFC